MYKSLETDLAGHNGEVIHFTSEEAFNLLKERKFKSIEQCAFLLSFLEISPEDEEWGVITEILSELEYPENVVSDFLFESDLKLTAVPVTINFEKTFYNDDLHCEAADTHFSDSYTSFEEMLLQQNLAIRYALSGQNSDVAIEIALFGIITMMPHKPIITLNNAVLLPGVLYPLKLTGAFANNIHRYAMRRFINIHRDEIIETIDREVEDILNCTKSNPELINALEKMVNDYIRESKLGAELRNLVRILQAFIDMGNTSDIQKKIQDTLAIVVSKVETYPEAKFDIDFSTLLVKPGRMVTSSSRKSQDLPPEL